MVTTTPLWKLETLFCDLTILSNINLICFTCSHRLNLSSPNSLVPVSNCNLTMPAVAKERNWCTCCKKFLTRKREREHRQAATRPHIIPPVTHRQFTFLSALFSDDEDDIPALATVDHCEDDEDLYPSPGNDFEEPSEPVADPMDVDDLAMASDRESGVNAESCDSAGDDEDTVFHSYRPAARAWTPSDLEDDVDDDLDHSTLAVPQEDPYADDEVDAVDWDALEKECGLSAWDQLGESYEADAAGIGMLFW